MDLVERHNANSAVLEIGVGYGGMARQLLQYCDDIQIVLCDLPETLYIAWHWLTQVTDRTIGWLGDDTDVVLLAAQELGDAVHALEPAQRPEVRTLPGIGLNRNGRSVGEAHSIEPSTLIRGSMNP